MDRKEIGFTCSGQLRLPGRRAVLVRHRRSTRVGAWPPISESHVEMDAAWALYEAWVAIQTGDVDTRLVYGFGKSSLGDLHEIMTLPARPVLRGAAVAVDGRPGRAAGPART